MVDAIKGQGNKTIIRTSMPKKNAPEKADAKFSDQAKIAKEAAKTEAKSFNISASRAANEVNTRLTNQAQIERNSKIAEITKQIQDGSYKMPSPEELADKLLSVISDKQVKEKFIKKLLEEEREKLQNKYGDSGLTELGMKKLVFMVTQSHDEEFDDPELENMIKEYLL